MAGLTRSAAALAAAVALSGCGSEPRTLEGRNLETTLVGAMNARLDGLAVRRVDCVFLTRELTRCFAEGTAAERPFRLPVSVGRRDAEMVWSVAEEDLRDVRRGTEPAPLRPGDVVAVAGPDGERVQVRVRAPIDPLEVTYPEVTPKYGNRYVALPVELHNRGPRVYADSPLSRISATLTDGSLVTHASVDSGECASPTLERIRLQPGERTRGCVAFEVPDRLDVAAIAVQLGYSESVLEWALEREAPAA